MKSTTVYNSIIYVSSIVLIIINIAYSRDLNEYLTPVDEDSKILTNKRYAMLSYNYGRPRGRYGGWNSGGDDGKRYRYKTFWRPWEKLQDTQCYRKRCNTSSDCCRRYNICDNYAHVCYDCWYGFRCNTSDDCCKRFPYCNPRRKICTS